MEPSRHADLAAETKALEQIYGLRGWLTSVLADTLRSEATVKWRIATLEREAEGLREQLGQFAPAVSALRHSIDTVDGVIRRRRDEVRGAMAAEAAPSPPAEPTRETPGRRNENEGGASRRR